MLPAIIPIAILPELTPVCSTIGLSHSGSHCEILMVKTYPAFLADQVW